MVSHRSLSDKSSQVSRTLLSIVADLNNAVVWIGSTCPRISMSSIPFTNSFGIVPGAPTTIDITVTLMFHSLFFFIFFFYVFWGFFCSVTRSCYISLLSLTFIFTQ